MTRRWIPGTRRGRVLTVGPAGLVLAAVLLWNVPLAGQWRGEPPLTQLLPQSPPGPGPWDSTSEGMYFSEPGLDEDEQKFRGFALHGSDILRHGFSQSVKRFDSPTWAWLAVRRSPAQDKPWSFPPVEPAGSRKADDQSYTCLVYSDSVDGCERWYGHIRYGQYVVDIAVNGREQAPQALALLQEAVLATDALMPE
ncbi:hypothetical protein ACFWBN_24265 [Streptomyces sp. NPDC059989]|uniref:hypothetical protein n=1 Tax=Streptomyces sp. NPDC059989 TaxID=3347026 RepID=UPI00368A2EAE